MSDEEARRFALEHAHYRDDLDWWRAAARRLGSPVLDLGAAVGRLAIPLARDGAEVWALDRSPAMLAELRARLAREPEEVRARVRAVRGDIRSFALGRRFALAMLAMNTFQVLTAPADRLACLRAVRAHLLPRGELLLDIALPDPDEIAGSLGVERPGARHRDPATGAEVHHSAWYDAWDPASGTLEFTLRIVERRGDGGRSEFLRRHRVHLARPDEMAGLLERAGLRPVELAGDFSGGRLDPAGERQVYRCRRAA